MKRYHQNVKVKKKTTIRHFGKSPNVKMCLRDAIKKKQWCDGALRLSAGKLKTADAVTGYNFNHCGRFRIYLLNATLSDSIITSKNITFTEQSFLQLQ